MSSTKGRQIFDSPIILESNRKYGQPAASGDLADSTYIWKVDTGSKVLDFIRKLSENYGYSYGTSGYDDGAPFFSEIQGENRIILEPRWLANYVVYPYTGFNYENVPSWWNYGVPGNLDGMRFLQPNTGELQSTTSINSSVSGNEDIGRAEFTDSKDGLYFTEDYIRVEKDFVYTFVVHVKNSAVNENYLDLFVDTEIMKNDEAHSWSGAEFIDGDGNNVISPSAIDYIAMSVSLTCQHSGYIRPKLILRNNPNRYKVGVTIVYIDNIGLYLFNPSEEEPNITYRKVDDDQVWKFMADAKALGGGYHEAETDSDSDVLIFTIPGVKFEIISILGPDAGNSVSYKLFDEVGDLAKAGEINQYRADKRYYNEGLIDNVNPCVTLIDSDDYGDPLTYQKYRFTISGINSGLVSRINTVISYANNKASVVDTLYTGDSGSNVGRVTKLSLGTSSSELRNDIIVIGASKGVFLVDPGKSDSPVVNPNNPINRRVYARAVNADSIYDPTAVNYIGFKQQAIVIEPAINSEERADWLAEELVRRHSVIKKTSSWESAGQPLLERNDKIAIIDTGKDTVDVSDEFWITGITNNITPDRYTTSYQVSPIKPWDSYVPNPNAYIQGVTDIVRNIVIQNELADGAFETNNESNKYDPYDSDRYDHRVKITMELSIDCRIKISIVDAMVADKTVVHLTDQTSQDDGWTNLSAGEHVFYWDGVDVFGDYNGLIKYNNMPIGKGFWVNIQDESKGYAKFYLKFSVLDSQTNELNNFTTRDEEYDKFIYTELSSNTAFTVKTKGVAEFSTSDEYYYKYQDTRSYPYFSKYHKDLKPNHELSYAITPDDPERKLFWTSVNIGFTRVVMAAHVADNYPHGDSGPAYAIFRRIDSPLNVTQELSKESREALTWNVSKQLFEIEGVAERITFGDFYTKSPTLEPDQLTDVYNDSVKPKILFPFNTLYYRFSHDLFEPDDSTFYIAWMVSFTFYICDKSGRVNDVKQKKFYYPWIESKYDLDLPTTVQGWINKCPQFFVSDAIEHAVYYDRGAGAIDFIRSVDGQGFHVFKGVKIRTKDWNA